MSKPNRFGVRVAYNTEDFSRWGWPDVDKIPVQIAETIVKELAKDAWIEFIVRDGAARVRFATFEGDFDLDVPITVMLKEWITGTAGEDPEDREALASALEAAVRALRSAIAKAQA